MIQDVMAVSVVQGKVVAVLADEKRKGAMNKLNTRGDILVAQNASLPKNLFPTNEDMQPAENA